MGRKSTSGGVTAAGDRIQLTFTYRNTRCRPTLALKPTPPNLAHARRLVADIEERIRTANGLDFSISGEEAAVLDD